MTTPKLTPTSLPQPDFEVQGVASWATKHSFVVADTRPLSLGIYLYPRREDQHLVENPEELIATLRAATAFMDRNTVRR